MITDDYKVFTLSLFDARCSVAAIRDAFYRETGTWCSEPEALAAAYSVPDGAPLGLAVLNVSVGAVLDDAQLAHFNRMRDSVHAFTRRAPGGYR